VAEQIRVIAFGVVGFTIVDAGKSRIGAQTLGCLYGKPGARRCVGTFYADQNQARGQTVTQLIHQQLLLKCGRARQKSRQVGGEVRAADDADTDQQKNQPQHDGRDATVARVLCH